ncbi:MAG: hypothetical protein VKL42_01770 [Snowella sp.]|nr:hypothetical protein [Snowella sp.]
MKGFNDLARDLFGVCFLITILAAMFAMPRQEPIEVLPIEVVQAQEQELEIPSQVAPDDNEGLYPIPQFNDKAEALFLKYKSPLSGKSPIFYQKGIEKGYTDEQIALLIAISGTESGFKHTQFHNYWGIMCTRNNKTSTDCGWTTDDYAIGRAYDLVGSYLPRWDGTKEGLKKTFIGSYCQSACTNWVDNTWYFYNEII